MKIFLLGLPGSGKSTLGKELATSLQYSFVDLDTEIEKATGKKIHIIFQEHGENHFRKLESDHLRKWATTATDFVMATGGGTPCFFDNMNLINASGQSIFLDVPAREIVRRIQSIEQSKRPHFANVAPAELKDKVEFMRSSRLPFYRQAQVTVAGQEITAKRVRDTLSPGT